MSEACPLISLQSFALISLQSLALILLQPRAAAVTHKGTIQWNGMDSNVWSCLRRWRVANYRHPLAPGLRQQWRVSNPEPAEVVAPLYALIWIQSFTSQCRHRHNVNKRRGRGPFHKGRDTLVSQFVVTGWSPRPRVVSQLPTSQCPPY